MHILYVTPKEYLEILELNDRCTINYPAFDEDQYVSGLYRILKLTNVEYEHLRHLRKWKVFVQWGINEPIVNRMEVI